MRVLVVADDFTGAAEIAAAGKRFGLSARVGGTAGDGVTAIDTNSRLMTPDQAVATVKASLASLDLSQFDLVYKKTDSVLRGPVAAEVLAVAEAAGRRGAILCPQNPTRGRTIVDGVYRINGVPLVQTQFARDPDYPATSSKVLDLLNRDDQAGNAICRRQLIVGEGDDVARLRHWASQCGHDLLPAGGVDFFEAVLSTHGLTPQPADRPAIGGRTLMVLGSACESSRALVRQLDPDLLCTVPTDRVSSTVHRRRIAVLAFPDRRDPSLPAQLVDAVTADVDALLIEGGSTAAAVFARFEWREFDVLGEFAVGVVALRPPGGPVVVVKPGSYPWPDSILEGLCSAASV
jgi:uncharacterized protein YgbK (DUF1537 family)